MYSDFVKVTSVLLGCRTGLWPKEISMIFGEPGGDRAAAMVAETEVACGGNVAANSAARGAPSVSAGNRGSRPKRNEDAQRESDFEAVILMY